MHHITHPNNRTRHEVLAFTDWTPMAKRNTVARETQRNPMPQWKTTATTCHEKPQRDTMKTSSPHVTRNSSRPQGTLSDEHQDHESHRETVERDWTERRRLFTNPRGKNQHQQEPERKECHDECCSLTCDPINTALRPHVRSPSQMKRVAGEHHRQTHMCLVEEMLRGK